MDVAPSVPVFAVTHKTFRKEVLRVGLDLSVPEMGEIVQAVRR